MAKADRLKQRSVRNKSASPNALDLIEAMIEPAQLPVAPGYARPEDAIVIQPDGSFQYGRATLTSTGMHLPADMSEADWMAVGQILQKLEQSIQWTIGDWMAFAERVWGKTYAVVEELTGYSYQTLRDYAYVARNVPHEVRRADLTFSHHRVVASLHLESASAPDLNAQRYWLEQAAEQGWSQARLRQEIERALTAHLPAPAPAETLAAPRHRRVINRIWKQLRAGQAVNRADIVHLRRWLDDIESVL